MSKGAILLTLEAEIQKKQQLILTSTYPTASAPIIVPLNDGHVSIISLLLNRNKFYLTAFIFELFQKQSNQYVGMKLSGM